MNKISLLIFILSLAMTSCGRKGPLDHPQDEKRPKFDRVIDEEPDLQFPKNMKITPPAPDSQIPQPIQTVPVNPKDLQIKPSSNP
jgi:predicted small lipoprotein YifL